MIRKRLLVLGLCLIVFASSAIAEKLEKDTVIRGIKCKGGYWVGFYYNEKFEEVVLAGNQVIQGIKCMGWPFPKYYDKSWHSDFKKVLFYESGQLKSAPLAGDQIIQGIKCNGGYPVRFYDNGKLKLCINEVLCIIRKIFFNEKQFV